MENFNFYFRKLLDYFGCDTIAQLAQKLNVSHSVVSSWKQRQSVSALIKKCEELNIYDNIFGITPFEHANTVAVQTGTEDELNGILLRFAIQKKLEMSSKINQKDTNFVLKMLDFADSKKSQTIALLIQILKEFDSKNLNLNNSKNELKLLVQNYTLKIKDRLKLLATQNTKKNIEDFLEELDAKDAYIILSHKNDIVKILKEFVQIQHL